MPSITQTVNKAAMLIKPHHVEIRDIGIPTIKANEVLVQVRVNGLCGSDLRE
jgi:L-iditol 2-dehydrogenase